MVLYRTETVLYRSEILVTKFCIIIRSSVCQLTINQNLFFHSNSVEHFWKTISSWFLTICRFAEKIIMMTRTLAILSIQNIHRIQPTTNQCGAHSNSSSAVFCGTCRSTFFPINIQQPTTREQQLFLFFSIHSCADADTYIKKSSI
jgi:hypothetical protein